MLRKEALCKQAPLESDRARLNSERRKAEAAREEKARKAAAEEEQRRKAAAAEMQRKREAERQKCVCAWGGYGGGREKCCKLCWTAGKDVCPFSPALVLCLDVPDC
eukprot:1157850-Pelagomonas_calceolata.AAC.9